MASNITLSKGGTSVTIYSTRVDEEYKNKLFPITPPQTKSNQSSGPKSTKIVDLLRVTHYLNIKGWIQTATDKENLVTIFRGAGLNGGTVTLAYDDCVGLAGSTDSITGYVEECTVSEESQDNPTYSGDDHGRYEVEVKFLEGVNI